VIYLANHGFPEIVQVEPTNQCNFNCIMCIRRFWNAKLGHMDFSLYRRLAESTFPHVKRVVLYGEGEPLIHPKFIDMVKFAREKLPREGTIFFTTNGSLLAPNIADKLIKKIGVDSIAISMDTVDFKKLERIRVGVGSQILFNNLKHVAKIKKDAKRDFKLGIEVVVMRSNIDDLPETVKIATEYGIDFISVSHILPYTKNLYDEVIYTTISEESLKLSDIILQQGWDLILGAVYEEYSLIYGDGGPFVYEGTLRKIWEEAKKRDIEINPPLLLRTKEKLDWIEKIKGIFRKSEDIARSYGIELDLPDIVPIEKARKCPYVEKNATVIRYDGEVAPCFNYLYSHPTFVNNHIRNDYAVSFGNIKNKSLFEIWNSKEYVEFRERLKDMPKNVPYCGNCPYSSNYCWYTLTNEIDCYQNQPSCNECLYSTNLVKCLI